MKTPTYLALLAAALLAACSPPQDKPDVRATESLSALAAQPQIEKEH